MGYMKAFKKNILWALLAVLILGNAAAAGLFYFKIKNRKMDEKSDRAAGRTERTEGINAAKVGETGKERDAEALDEFGARGERVVKTDRQISITWNYMRESVNTDEIFGDDRFEKIAKAYEKKHKERDGQSFGCEMSRAGAVSSGAYVNDEVYLLVCGEPGIGGYYGPKYITIKNGDDLVVLAGYSDEPIDYMKDFVVIDEGAAIQVNENIPDAIKVPDSDISLIKSEERKIWNFFFSVPVLTPIFSYDGTHYLSKGSDNCYYVEVGDGTVVQYDFPDDFFILDFINENGEKNQETYSHAVIGGCGAKGCYNYSPKTKNELDKIGVTGSGRDVFRAKDSEETRKSYRHIYEKEYRVYGAPKESYDDFVRNAPLLYIRDPFGDFIELKNEKYLPQVECGKPVIYLYPEQEMDVRVFIRPNGGLTVVEPDYDQDSGWLVRAKPNGDLFNYQDGLAYPYLFWEGRGLGYERPEEGFVVGRDEVRAFLGEKLIELGLVKKEADEFIAFWLPKMREKNFYFISFMPQEEFDSLAPLDVIPKPDTVIRVFMDFEGLDEEVAVEEQKIITPERSGFTVVEWGGALR